MKGQSAIAYIVGAISINAILEMVAATIFAGGVGFALCQAKFIELPEKFKKSKSVTA
jgi:hypothetical protein